jgi:hypothetical protein
MERDAGNKDAARKAVEAILAADPGDREAQALADQLR